MEIVLLLPFKTQQFNSFFKLIFWVRDYLINLEHLLGGGGGGGGPSV